MTYPGGNTNNWREYQERQGEIVTRAAWREQRDRVVPVSQSVVEELKEQEQKEEANE